MEKKFGVRHNIFGTRDDDDNDDDDDADDDNDIG